MVTADVTYLLWIGGKRVAHRQTAGTARQGANQAALHGAGAGRGVRGQQAHDAEGPARPRRDGRAAPFDAGTGRRVLAPAGRSAALAFSDGGRSAGADRLLRGLAALP